MKKLTLLVIMTFYLIILTGCGNTKTLTCTQEEDSVNDKIDKTGLQVKLVFNKDGEDISKYIQTAYINYNKTISDEDFDLEYNDANSACDEYKNYTGVTCKAIKNGKKISLVIEVDVKKANDETKTAFYLNELDEKNYDDMKKNAEESGYTCK